MTVQKNKTTTSSGFQIRPFQYGDIDTVAEMSGEYFPEKKQADISQLKENLQTNIAQSGNTPSLVCASDNGQIHGYICVNTVDFDYKGTAIKMAVCSDFMVDEKARKSLVPMRMLQKFLDGPQDLSFTDDAIEASRMLWCKLGGEIAYPYSIYYQVPLRPVSFLQAATAKSLPSWTSNIFKPAASAIDRGLQAFRAPFSHVSELDHYSIRPLTLRDFEEGLTALRSQYDLFPSISTEMLDGHIIESKKQTHFGSFESAAIVDSNQEVVGWFLYYFNDENRCNVIHAQSQPGKEDVLFHCLKRDAFAKGGISLSGRASPNQLSSNFVKKSLSRPGKNWVLIHSEHPEIIHTIQSGNAFLSQCW